MRKRKEGEENPQASNEEEGCTGKQTQRLIEWEGFYV